MKMLVQQIEHRPSRCASQPDDDRGQADQAQSRIAHRAYKLYAQRGHDFEDWLEAERQIPREAGR